MALITDRYSEAEVKFGSRPDLQAHATAVSADFTSLVDRLQNLLGVRLVAYIGSVGETRAVREWASGERTTSNAVEARMRCAYQLAAMIEEIYGAKITQSWFQGLNPLLDDYSPATLLRESGEKEAVGRKLINAARTFLAG